MKHNALIVVDVQPDFCEGGALPVLGGNLVAYDVAALIPHFHGFVATSQDWHRPMPDLNGGHFAEPGTDPDYSATWPVHCVAGTEGAELHPAIAAALRERREETITIRKGWGVPDYSAFQGLGPDGRTLGQTLRFHDVGTVHIVGLATDHCVRATALDALAEGFEVNVVWDLTAAVGGRKAAADVATELYRAGVHR